MLVLGRFELEWWSLVHGSRVVFTAGHNPEGTGGLDIFSIVVRKRLEKLNI